MKNIISLNNIEAKKYFLSHEAYCNFSLPPYFNFEPLLEKIDSFLKKETFEEFCKKNKILNQSDINYKIIINKDGNLAWRPLQLINPFLYVVLVRYITQIENWTTLQEKFRCFQQDDKIKCKSIPISSFRNLRRKQISYWCKEIEQASFKQFLNYNYCFATDISDCYGSIYTHSIAWAIHGKDEAKKNRNGKTLGNGLDKLLRLMNDGQTNGIPQGSCLMDFIAEIVLGYADFQLSEKISNTIDFKILRYRDDYRIFVNNLSDGNLVLKHLTDVLLDLNFKLNPQKTAYSDDIISMSIKKEKADWLMQEINNKNNLKKLLIIYFFSRKHQNSGIIKKLLTTFNKSLKINKNDDIEVLINISIAIAYYNPDAFNICILIVSRLLQKINNKVKRESVSNNIIKKIVSIAHTNYASIWLQRCFIKEEKLCKIFEEKLCMLISDYELQLDEIWNFKWIHYKNIQNIIDRKNVVDTKVLNKIPLVINEDEVNIFQDEYGDSIIYLSNIGE